MTPKFHLCLKSICSQPPSHVEISLDLAQKNVAPNITVEILIKSRNCISKYINAIIFPEKNFNFLKLF